MRIYLVYYKYAYKLLLAKGGKSLIGVPLDEKNRRSQARTLAEIQGNIVHKTIEMEKNQG